MSRFYTPILIIASIAIHNLAIATTISPQDALSRLNNSDKNYIADVRKNPRNIKLSTVYGELYIFESENGFFILPNDDQAPALLAFSDSGQFDVDANSALKMWLEYYNKELQYLHTSTVRTHKISTVKTPRIDIAPLLKTEWNQEAPYNMLCPKVNGHDVVTGCVATAMAQFMKYYNYPIKGKGRHSYYWGVGKDTLSLDYDTIPFQWNLMTDTYDSKSDEASKKAVAELMLACGISVDMHYDIGDSGAATTHMGVSLIDIFNYSPSLWMAHREYYGYDEWIGMIYDELSKGNPVLYSGQGTAGGHQFLCDGYKDDGYFHFNWGWGGLSNGYFLLTALNPDDLGVGGGAGGFNTDQIATLSARPPQDGDEKTYIMYNSGAFVTDVTTVKADEEFKCDGTYFNYSMSTLPDDSKLGMKFVNVATNEAQFVQGPNVAGLHLDEGRYFDIIKFPALSNGTYYITPSLHADGKWSEVKMPLGSPNRITAVVTDGVATLSSESNATISINDIVVPDTIYAGHDFPLEFTAYNNSDLEYYANVTPYLLNSSGVEVAISTYRPMDVLSNASESVTDYVANFSAVSGQTLDPGNYQLVFRNSGGIDISSPIKVHVETTVETTEIKITDFRLVSDNPVTNPAKIEFAFTLSCTSGVYYSCPHILIFPGDGGYEQAGLTGKNQYLTSGDTRVMTIDGDLERLKDGGYMAAVYNDGKAQTDFIHFELHRLTTSHLDIWNNVDSHYKNIYTIDGRVYTGQITPGFYIINGKLTILK